jgi:transposase
MGLAAERWPARLWLVQEPVDMRCGMDRLSALVNHAVGQNVCDGTAYVFRNRAGQRLKVLVFDGTGVWLCARRLHRGRFVWPAPGAAQVTLTLAQWRWLITGVDWQRLCAGQPGHWQV